MTSSCEAGNPGGLQEFTDLFTRTSADVHGAAVFDYHAVIQHGYFVGYAEHPEYIVTDHDIRFFQI